MYAVKQKKNILLLCTAAVSLAAIILLWIIATPDAPTFSKDSGFYQQEFDLHISAPIGTRVYYTLDGSDPDENAIPYTGPIHISNATPNENRYSARTDTTAGFYTDLIEHYKTLDGAPGYVVPDMPVDKCTVVRAAAVNKNGEISRIVSRTFFVGIQPSDYHDCNIISIITDPDNLFDARKGIYVTGDVFDRHIYGENVGETNQEKRSREQVGQYWRFWNANYRERGKNWEREAVFQAFNAKGEQILDKKGGIRTHGGVSRGTIPRSLNLYARAEYDGRDKFGVDFFGNGYDPQRLTHFAGGNRLITLFNDYLITRQTRNLHYTTILSEPYVMFLDGEYWGFYWLTEKYDSDYLAHYFGVKDNNIIMIKNGQIEEGDESDITFYHQMAKYICSNDMSQPENYAKACTMIDMESYIDYYAAMIYIARCEDWPNSNVALWRTKAIGNDPYSDGKWRWMMFDCNSTCMTAYLDLQHHDTIDFVIQTDTIFCSLWRSDVFREAFFDRLLYIADTCFDKDTISQVIDDYTAKMLPILEKSWARYYGSDNNMIEYYFAEIESIRTFFNERREYVLGWIEKE